MFQRELATALGISAAMVSKLAKRGMPTDTLERAQRWRRRHLEPGRVKGMRFGTAAPAPPPARPRRQENPEDIRLRAVDARLDSAAPDFVSVLTVEAVGAACGHLLESEANPDETKYLLTFMRDLFARTDPSEVGFRLPVGVWLRLVEHWIHSDAIERIRRAANTEAIDATEFGRLTNPERPMPPLELVNAAADMEGISLLGWPDDPDQDEA